MATTRTPSRNAPPINPSIEFVDGPDRTKRAEEYEKRISNLLNSVAKGAANNPSTAPDAAAIIIYGPGLASKAGDLADQDDRVRAAIDFITTGTENPYIALVAAAMPLVLQIIRNHENQEIDTGRMVNVKIPFTKKSLKLPLRFKFRLKNRWFRGFTAPPEMVSASIFNNPEIAAKLIEEGVDLSWMNGGEPSANGTAKRR